MRIVMAGRYGARLALALFVTAVIGVSLLTMPGYASNAPSCSGVLTLLAAPPYVTAGTPVTFTASASGCTNPDPMYEFWMRPSTSSTWSMVQTFSISNLFNWDTTGISGDYYISVWAKDAASLTSTFDTKVTVAYRVYPARTASCTGVTLTAAPPYQSVSGTQVTFTANATGCTNASPLYEFWMRTDISNTWTRVQSYSTNNLYRWDTSRIPGGYYISVWAKDAASTAATLDVYNTTHYIAYVASCPLVTLSSSPASPQAAGTAVTFTAITSSSSPPTYSYPNPDPLYEYWLRPASSDAWSVVQAYSTNNLFHWNTSGLSGSFYVSVWAKDAASATATFDVKETVAYQVTGASCTSVAVSSAPTSVVHGSGTHVTVTASATGCTNSPRYEFWMRPAGSTRWQLVQGYGTSASYDWNSSGALAGTVYFSAWARDANSTASYDTFASTPVTVS
jgi:hypothetical protein